MTAPQDTAVAICLMLTRRAEELTKQSYAAVGLTATAVASAEQALAWQLVARAEALLTDAQRAALQAALYPEDAAPLANERGWEGDDEDPNRDSRLSMRELGLVGR